jgi:hypothetical protein
MAGCAEEQTGQVDKVIAPNADGYSTMGGGDIGDPESYDDEIIVDGSSIFEDDNASWDGWTITSPGQAWTDAETGKWIGFDPEPNQAVSPAFKRGTSEMRVRFGLFLPEAFPVLGRMEFITPRQLFGVATHNILSPEGNGSASWIDVELAQASWRIVPRTRSASGEVTSGSEFMIPWAFATGWNQVELTVRVRDGGANDDLQFRVGEKVYAWTGVDLASGAEPFRHVLLGRWEPGTGDQLLAIRDLEVLDQMPSLEMASPPTGVDYARGGTRITSGFWSGWMVRNHSGAIRFYDRTTHGAMRDHTQGVIWMGTGKERSGQVTMRVRFHGDQLTTTGSGRHLLSITSRPLCFTPREYGLTSWTRVDLDRPAPGRIRAVVFNIVNDVRLNGGRWPTKTFSVPFAAEQWANLNVDWQMDGNRLTLKVNGVANTFTLLQGSEPPGIYLGLGNMDSMTGAIDFDDVRITN